MRKHTRSNLKALKRGLFFIWPWLIGLTVFNIVPFMLSLYYSFTDYSLLTPPRWIGLTNFKWLLEDRAFRIALWNTFWFVLVAGLVGLLLALTLSIMLYSVREKAMRWLRAVYYFPGLVPGVIMALVWKLMLNPNYGIFNFFLDKLGISAPLWFHDPFWAKPGIVLLLQFGVGGNVVIYLAALSSVPVELYEAASIDGAGIWHKIIKITIPSISPAIFFCTVTGAIWTFQLFTEPFIISNTLGGPDRSTLTSAIFAYKEAFACLHMGYASATTWILFVIMFALTLLFLKISKGAIYYRGG